MPSIVESTAADLIHAAVRPVPQPMSSTLLPDQMMPQRSRIGFSVLPGEVAIVAPEPTAGTLPAA